MLYFAYGSNMLLARLQARVPSAQAIGVASLAGHRRRFHKRSKDGSGKCNVYETENPDDLVYGVVFRIDGSEKSDLDRVEGLGYGYEEKVVEVIGHDGALIAAYTYYAHADYIEESLQPYTWYKDFVVEGAKQNDLPEEYRSEIEEVEAREDPDLERTRLNALILQGP